MPDRSAEVSAFLRTFQLPAAMVVVTASAKSEAYARAAITISTAIVRLWSIISLRSVVNSSRGVVAVAPVVALAIVSAMGAKVS